ncbi:MAG TPA: hypothetical protein VGF94_07820 [Kofleriaceae bacterium]
MGDHCSDRGDCGGSLQCVENTCVPACQRAPDCGDGFACEPDGTCRPATGELGDNCTSEVECAPGLSCSFVAPASLAASCVAEQSGGAAGEGCSGDTDCRNGTCALGRCVDLCNESRDCIAGTSCTQIPRIEAAGGLFSGCLQSLGTIAWDLPIHGPSDPTVLLPIPANAHSVAVTFEVSDPLQLVGATSVTSPTGAVLVTDNYFMPGNYFTDPVRHQLGSGEAVLAMPSSPDTPLETGAYAMAVTSRRGDGTQGTATPKATAVIKVDSDVLLDLHFYFLDFTDHPCTTAYAANFDASAAQSGSFFQNDFLGALRSVFADGGVQLAGITYEDITDHPELDAPEQQDESALLALGTHSTGVNVFFVRTLSPIGIEALGPTPGPAGIAGSLQSGVIVALDSLCYQPWDQLARLTAHEIAKYMGLYENVDLDGNPDPISDTDSSTNNLMFNSVLGGTALSPDQRSILAHSVVLQ